MNFIEEGRENLRNQRAIVKLNEAIFRTATDILEAEGRPMREYFILGYLGVSHTVNSGEPPIHVNVFSGTSITRNLERNRKTWIHIEGKGTLIVRKKGPRGRERFEAEEYREGYSYKSDLSGKVYPHYDLDIIKGYLSVVEQVRIELGVI